MSNPSDGDDVVSVLGSRLLVAIAFALALVVLPILADPYALIVWDWLKPMLIIVFTTIPNLIGGVYFG